MEKSRVIFSFIMLSIALTWYGYADDFDTIARTIYSERNGIFTSDGSLSDYGEKIMLHTALLKGDVAEFNRHLECKGLFSSGDWSSMDNVPARMQYPEKPSLSNGKILGCFIAGTLGGIATGYAGMLIGWSVGWRYFNYDEEEGPASVILGYGLGSIPGSALGVYLIGNSSSLKGSLGRTILGSTVGAGAAIVAAFVGMSVPYLYWVVIPSLYILPPIFAIWFFDKSLRYKSLPEHDNALFNFREGRLRIGIPLINIQPLTDYRGIKKKSFRVNVNVLSIKL